METIDKLLNAPIIVVFKIGDKNVEFSFRELSQRKTVEYRSKLMSRARSEWLERIKSIGQTIDNDKERRKYLVEAAQQEPDWYPELSRLSTTTDGIKWALQLGATTDLSNDVFEQLNRHMENITAVTQAMNVVLGIHPTETPNVEAGAAADPIPGPQPGN